MSLKKILLSMIRLGVSCVYGVFKLFSRPTNKVVFLSRQSDNPSENFLLLSERLKQLDHDIKIEYSCKLGLKNEMGLSYIPILLGQLRMLAGARACVTESYCPSISLPKHRKSLNIVQIWHSMVAIKQFGWMTVGEKEGSDPVTAREMRMHSGYTSVVCGSEHQRSLFSQAMRTPIERIYPYGAPSADVIMRLDRTEGRRRFDAAHPEAVGKKVVLYAPTMRRERPLPCRELMDAFGKLNEQTVLVIRPHPLDKWSDFSDADGCIIEREISTRELLSACDAVISDYSGAAAEASLLRLPVYFYIPDIEQYSADCGLAFDVEQLLPDITFRNADALIERMGEGYPSEQSERVFELLAGGCDGSSTDRIAKLILTQPQ